MKQEEKCNSKFTKIYQAHRTMPVGSNNGQGVRLSAMKSAGENIFQFSTAVWSILSLYYVPVC